MRCDDIEGTSRRSPGFIGISIVAGEKGSDRIVYPYSKYQTLELQISSVEEGISICGLSMPDITRFCLAFQTRDAFRLRNGRFVLKGLNNIFHKM